MNLQARYYVLTILLLTFLIQTTNAQELQYKALGRITGTINDSINLSPLPEATVSIYHLSDTSLISYRLNDNSGRFSFTGLPADTSLLIIVTYVGYNTFRKTITIPSGNSILSLNSILLSKANNMLREVVVKLPPMQMKGDTLEFNADAFKSQPNAVIGDLIRKLPGFVIWGDGKITVNGKNVSQVLVEGKPFLTGDSRVSLNNLPKVIVDKIQVIPDKGRGITGGNLNDTIANTVSVNLALKKGKKSGTFGKIGSELGNEKHYGAELMLAHFSPESQFSAVGASNDLNKTTTNVNDLMVNNSYQTRGNSRRFLGSDFNQRGANSQTAGALNFTRNWNDKWRSTGDYYLSNQDSRINEENFFSTLLADSAIERQSRRSINQNSISQNIGFDLGYRDSTFNLLNIKSKLSLLGESSRLEDSLQSKSSLEGVINSINNRDVGSSDRTVFILESNFSHAGRQNSKGLSKEDYYLEYSLERSSRFANVQRVNELTNFLTGGNKLFNRKTALNETGLVNNFFAKYASLGQLLGLKSTTQLLSLQNNFYLNSLLQDVNVWDFNSQRSVYDINNEYLTNKNQLRMTVNKPGIKADFTFSKSFAARYYKSLSFSLLGQVQLTRFKNASDEGFRRFNKSYKHFIPELSINTRNIRYGKYEQRTDIGYLSSVEIPTIDQLAPLVDSSIQYYLNFGNRNLKESLRNTYYGKFNWTSTQENGFSFKVEATGGQVKNYISDSTYFDSSGRQISYPININGYHFVDLKSEYTKSAKIRGSIFRISLSPSFSYNKRPSIVNETKIISVNRLISLSGSIGFTLNELLNIELGENYLYYYTFFQGNEFNLHSHSSFSEIHLSWPKNFTLASSLRFIQSGGDRIKGASSFILDAYLSYRMSKKKQFEMKVSANDIFNENQGITNRVFGNSVSFDRVNRLKQYFTLGISYYPRRFGSSKR